MDSQSIQTIVLAKVGKTTRLVTAGNEPVQFTTPLMWTPFGVNSSSKEWMKFTEYSVSASIDSEDPQKESFEAFSDAMDARVKDLVKNSFDSFNTKTKHVFDNPESVDAFKVCSVLKENGGYPKLMKMTLTRNQQTGVFTTALFDTAKTRIKMSDSDINDVITRGKAFKAIVQCDKVWVFNGMIGVTWTISQLKFCDRIQSTLKDTDESSGTPEVYTQLLID